MALHPSSRALPPQLDAVGQQLLLNLAVTGAKIIDDGLDLTDAVLSRADETNKAFDDWLADYRSATAERQQEAHTERVRHDAAPARAVSKRVPITTRRQG
jgi:hypothetical protein